MQNFCAAFVSSDDTKMKESKMTDNKIKNFFCVVVPAGITTVLFVIMNACGGNSVVEDAAYQNLVNQWRSAAKKSQTTPYDIKRAWGEEFDIAARTLGITPRCAGDSAEVCSKNGVFSTPFKDAGQYGNPEAMGEFVTLSEKLSSEHKKGDHDCH